MSIITNLTNNTPLSNVNIFLPNTQNENQKVKILDLNGQVLKSVKSRKLKKGTKADKVRQIVQKRIGDELVRPKDIIDEIMKTVQLKKSAASTYYYNAKRTLAL